jgi:hypothetical protein
MKKIIFFFLLIVSAQAGCTLTDPEVMEMLKALQAQNDKLLEEITQMKGQVSDLDGKYQVILAGLADNKKEFDALKSQMDGLKTQIAIQLLKINQVTSQLELQGADIEKLSGEIVKLKASIEELKALMEELLAGKSPVPTNGLVAWYPFNGNANDESGNGNNGTVNGATLTLDRNGFNQKAFNFNDNQYIEVPNSEMKNTYPFAISLWVSISDKATGGSIFNKYVSATWNGYAVQFIKDGNGGVIYPLYLNGGPVPNGIIGGYGQTKKFIIEKPELEKWVHFVFVVDNSGGKIYFDGKFIESIDWRNNPSASSNNFTWHIGGKSGRTWPSGTPEAVFFQGKIDDVSIYNRALTMDEISKLYNGEKF